uniref:PARNIA n=1 Tax=Odontobuthus doriae TaxID=342590 RepID=A0A173GNX5_ODODO|nr:PARNIA [Odontobuthus doriae]
MDRSLLLILLAITLSNALFIPGLVKREQCSKAFGEKCRRDSECCGRWICAFDMYNTLRCGYEAGP